MDSNSEAYKQKKIEMTTRNLPKNFITEQSGWRSGRVLHHDRIWDAWTSGMPEN